MKALVTAIIDIVMSIFFLICLAFLLREMAREMGEGKEEK